MSQCPRCQVALPEVQQNFVRCPQCGCELTPQTAAFPSAESPEVSPRVHYPGEIDGLENTQIDSLGFGQTERFLSGTVVQNPAPAETIDAFGEQMDTVGPAAATRRDSAGDSSPTIDVPAPQQLADTLAVPALQSSETTSPMPALDTTLDGIHPTWGAALDAEVPPTMSIKSGFGSVDGSQPSLVIQPRRLASAKASESRANADYEIVSLLGKGGMGMVFSARQGSLDRHVAVKMLKPEGANNPLARDSFLSEACVTGDLEHPNIVPIYDLGYNSDGAFFYSMKQVKGTPWNKVIRQNSQVENVEILMRVCDAIALAHSKGIIHRDLKPENTMIGDFGEVLVMDWGLAIPTDRKRKIGGIELAATMAGTPTYMAPEMARGPYEDISTASDIYLLGAILFEIVTGKPPHTGTSARDCMLAAARNEIRQTDKQGPLLDIALQAMRTQPHERFATVGEFQNAIRQYQSNAESIALAAKAADLLAQGRQSKDYEPLSRSVFAFQEALELWPENARAAEGLLEARCVYADAAYQRGDFDLAIGQLDASVPAQVALLDQIVKARDERELRKKRLVLYKRMGAAMAVALFTIVSGAAVWIDSARRDANAQRLLAVEQKDIAVAAEAKQREAMQAERVAKERALASEEQERLAKVDAEQKRIAAEKAEEEARLAKIEADNKRMEAEAAREQERLAKIEAEQKRIAAEEAQRNEMLARQSEAYETYVARIGAAAAKIDENAYDAARELLANCIPPDGETDHRNWEWGRLWYLCEQASKTLEVDFPVDTIAADYDASGKLATLAAGGIGGRVLISDQTSGRQSVVETGADQVHCVAISPVGQQLIVGTDDRQAFLKLIDLRDGRSEPLAIQPNEDHTDAVLSLEYSPSGRELLTASRDGKIKVWDTATRRVKVSLHGHRWWVWQAKFVPPKDRSTAPTRIVSVSQDATAVVWEDSSATWSDGSSVKRLPTFRGHDGPVCAVAISTDGETIATAGQDREILLWRPADLVEVDLMKSIASDDTSESVPSRGVLAGHTATVRSLAFAPVGDVLISSGHDNTVRIWDATSRRLIKTLRGHGRWVNAIAVAADGQSVVSASMDQTIRFWDIAGYEETRVLRGKRLAGHGDAVLAAEFSPLSDKIATASRDRTVKTWDYATGAELHSLQEGHAFFTANASVFAGGTRLATAAADNSVRLWNFETGSQQQRLLGTGTSGVVAASSDGALVLTGGPKQTDGQWTALLWDAATGEMKHELNGHQAMVVAVAISPDGRWLYTGDLSGTGRLWNASDGRLVKLFPWHQAKVLDASFSSDNRFLVTGAIERNVARWDLSQPGIPQAGLLVHPATLISMDVDPSGRFVVTGSNDRKLNVWDFESGKVVRSIELKGDTPEARSIDRVAISPDARRLLVVNYAQRTVRLFDIATGNEVKFVQGGRGDGPLVQWGNRESVWNAIFTDDDHVLTLGGDQVRLWALEPLQPPLRRLRMNFSPHGVVASAGFSTDATRLVSGSWDGTASIWDAETGIVQRKLIGNHSASVGCAVFSPDAVSKYVLTTSDDGTAVLWDSATGQFLRRFAGHAKPVRWGAFDRDATRILTASDDGKLCIWSVDDHTEPTHVLTHDAAVVHACFSPDGRTIASGSEDRRARIWDIDSGEVLQTLSTHTAPVTSVAYTPDGRRLLTGSEDFTAKLWDASTGKELLNLSGHAGEVSSVGFSPDHLNALTASYDGTSIIWMAKPWDQSPLALTTLRSIPPAQSSVETQR